MGLFTKNTTAPADSLSRCSSNFLFAVIASLINIIMFLVGGGFYLPFSVFVPYLTVVEGELFAFPERYFTVEETGTDELIGFGTPALVAALVIAAVILGVYVLCWSFSRPDTVSRSADACRRGKRMLTVALVLYAIDSAVMLLFAFTNGSFDLTFLIDIAFHAWFLYYLITGRKACSGLLDGFTAPDAVLETEAVVTDCPETDGNGQ